MTQNVVPVLLLTLLCATSFARSSIAPARTTLPPCSLSLAECLALSRENNATLRSSLAGVQIAKGENIVAWSRLLPQLSVMYQKEDRDSLAPAGSSNPLSDKGVSLRLSQRVLEFGPTTNEEIDRLRHQRRIVYRNEDVLVDILSRIRVAYFQLRIIQNQLAQHDSLYQIYEEKLAQTQSRLEQGVGLKLETFTARLNSLDAKDRILSLKLKQQNALAGFRELLGFTRTVQLIYLTTAATPFDIELDSCISIALRCNSEVADAQDEARLAKRLLLETGWDFAPDVTFTAGIGKERNAALIEVGSNRHDAAHTWAVDLVGTRELTAPDPDGLIESAYYSPLRAFRETSLRYTTSLIIEFPILTGGKRAGSSIAAVGRYEQARNEVIAKTRALERTVIDAYYQYHTLLEQLALQEERVGIDRERYALAETLKELGRMTEGEIDQFRSQVFASQDAYFQLQFSALEAQEHLRAIIRMFE